MGFVAHCAHREKRLCHVSCFTRRYDAFLAIGENRSTPGRYMVTSALGFPLLLQEGLKCICLLNNFNFLIVLSFELVWWCVTSFHCYARKSRNYCNIWVIRHCFYLPGSCGNETLQADVTANMKTNSHRQALNNLQVNSTLWSQPKPANNFAYLSLLRCLPYLFAPPWNVTDHLKCGTFYWQWVSQMLSLRPVATILFYW